MVLRHVPDVSASVCCRFNYAGALRVVFLFCFVGLNSFINESIPAYNNNISLSVKQVDVNETLKIANV